jgi:SAM-dependent methyltransferase
LKDSPVFARERAFHDDWAYSIRVEDLPLEASFNGSTTPEPRWIMQQLGDVRGMRLLELGTGAGEGAVNFALRGAEVTATDISPGMLTVVQRLAAYHNVSVSTRQCDADDLSVFADNTFDIVYAANVLHHVDLEKCLPQIRRVLKCEGRFAFWDPLAYNPAINVYRRMATQVRTEDEHPLRKRDIALIQRHFPHLHLNFFWLTALTVFAKFYFVDRIHPNADRYWKRIITHQNSIRWMYLPLAAVDRILMTVFPPFRWLCWNVAGVANQEGRK